MRRQRQFLVRLESDGTIRTVVSTSIRSAAKAFFSKYRPAKGDVLEVKERGIGDWEAFKVT